MALTDPIDVPPGASADAIMALRGALAQADAAIEAARIAGADTIRAAHISGRYALAAAIIVFVAAILGVTGAIWSARKQVRRAEQRHAARVTAYQFRIDALVVDLRSNIAVCLGLAQEALDRFTATPGHYLIRVPPLNEISDFSDENWEDHPLLGLDGPRVIYDVNFALRQYTAFQREVAKMGLRGDNSADDVQTYKDPVERDGETHVKQERVVESNVTLLTRLDIAVGRLERLLSSPPT